MQIEKLIIVLLSLVISSCSNRVLYDHVYFGKLESKSSIALDGFVYNMGIDNFFVSKSPIDVSNEVKAINSVDCIRLIVNPNQMNFISNNMGKKVTIYGTMANADFLNEVAQELSNQFGTSIYIRGRYWGGRGVSDCQSRSAIFVNRISIENGDMM